MALTVWPSVCVWKFMTNFSPLVIKGHPFNDSVHFVMQPLIYFDFEPLPKCWQFKVVPLTRVKDLLPDVCVSGIQLAAFQVRTRHRQNVNKHFVISSASSFAEIVELFFDSKFCSVNNGESTVAPGYVNKHPDDWLGQMPIGLMQPQTNPISSWHLQKPSGVACSVC